MMNSNQFIMRPVILVVVLWARLINAVITYPLSDRITIGAAVNLPAGEDALEYNGLDFVDLNGDGLTDVVYAGTESIYWMEAQGNGLFHPPSLLMQDGDNLIMEDGTTSTIWLDHVYPVSLRAADIDGDHDIDVVFGSRIRGSSNLNAALIVLLNDGTGTFTPQILLHSESISGPTKTLFEFLPNALEIADFNNDGYFDIVTSVVTYSGSEPPESYAGMLLYMENDGTGHFATKVLSEETKQLAHITIADFNEDGNDDIAVLSFGRSILWVFENDGSGNFESIIVDPSAVSNRALAAGDLDEDGHVDIVCLSNWRLTLYKNLNGDGRTFKEILLYEHHDILGDEGDIVLVHDVDGDGVNDIVTGPAFSSYGPRWFRQMNDQGTFTQPEVVADGASGGAISIAFVDINGDGLKDLVTAECCFNIYAYIASENSNSNDPCISSPCKDGELCEDLGDGQYQCNSQSQDNPCLPQNPCNLNEICVNLGNGQHQCRDEEGPCFIDPCAAFETCLELADGGYLCQYNSPCEFLPCAQGELCLDDGQGQYSCKSERSGCNWITWWLQILLGWLGLYFCDL